MTTQDRIAVAFAIFALFPLQAVAQDPKPAPGKPGPVDYEKDVKPIFEGRCYQCHGIEKAKGKLRLDQPETFVGKGPVRPGAPDKSRLIDLVKRAADNKKDRMPPKGDPLTTEQIATLERWIKEGAKFPKGTGAGAGVRKPGDGQEGKDPSPKGGREGEPKPPNGGAEDRPKPPGGGGDDGGCILES